MEGGASREHPLKKSDAGENGGAAGIAAAL